MNPQNFIHCYTKYKNSMDIITGDGGFDFSVNYNKQEEKSISLIFAQCIYASIMQKVGGSFILKIFDLFTLPSIQTIFFLHTLILWNYNRYLKLCLIYYLNSPIKF